MTVYGAGLVGGLLSEFTQTGQTQERVTVLPSRFRLPTPTQTAVKLTHLRTSTLGIPRPAQLLSWRFLLVALATRK